jgi:hypothetical protein
MTPPDEWDGFDDPADTPDDPDNWRDFSEE